MRTSNENASTRPPGKYSSLCKRKIFFHTVTIPSATKSAAASGLSRPGGHYPPPIRAALNRTSIHKSASVKTDRYRSFLHLRFNREGKWRDLSKRTGGNGTCGVKPSTGSPGGDVFRLGRRPNSLLCHEDMLLDAKSEEFGARPDSVILHHSVFVKRHGPRCYA